jgi:hypothetical protein
LEIQVFDDDYRPTQIGGRTQIAPFPRDPFGTVRKDPDKERYAVRVEREGRPRWWILCLVIPHDPADLRVDNLSEWPVIYTPVVNEVA